MNQKTSGESSANSKSDSNSSNEEEEVEVAALNREVNRPCF